MRGALASLDRGRRADSGLANAERPPGQEGLAVLGDRGSTHPASVVSTHALSLHPGLAQPTSPSQDGRDCKGHRELGPVVGWGPGLGCTRRQIPSRELAVSLLGTTRGQAGGGGGQHVGARSLLRPGRCSAGSWQRPASGRPKPSISSPRLRPRSPRRTRATTGTDVHAARDIQRVLLTQGAFSGRSPLHPLRAGDRAPSLSARRGGRLHSPRPRVSQPKAKCLHGRPRPR